MELLLLFWPALVLMLALSILLVPFGREVIQRRVVFLDLAVGQWAALGAAVGLLWGHQEWALWLGVITGALLAALLVDWLSKHAQQTTALEAPIGLLYALGLAVFMLLQANAGSQREVIAALVAYDVLFTSPTQALLSLAVALVVAIWWWRSRWLAAGGFYWLFALICAFAVKMAGLLVVFALLLAPALIGRSMAKQQLVRDIGIAIGLSWLALLLAFVADWPAGYTIIALLSLAAVSWFIWQSFRRSSATAAD